MNRIHFRNQNQARDAYADLFYQPTKCFAVGSRLIGDKYPTFIIAEIGQNHQGDVNLAKRLISIAADCKVDCVKFQKCDINSRFTSEVLQRPYKSLHAFGSTYGEHKQFLELADDEYRELKEYAESLGLIFAMSGMDVPSYDFINQLDVPFFKIGSGDATNLPLLKHVAEFGKPLIISTGMTNLETLWAIIEELKPFQVPMAIMQCTSSYPTPCSNINLNVIKVYRRLFLDCVIGYSGHETSEMTTVAAVALGAKIIERHLTLDRTGKGSDHQVSLEPLQFRHLVSEIRKVEEALGKCEKKIRDCEYDLLIKTGKTPVTTRTVRSGTILTKDHLTTKATRYRGSWPVNNYFDLYGARMQYTLLPEISFHLKDAEIKK